jgi:hypothetical protein
MGGIVQDVTALGVFDVHVIGQAVDNGLQEIALAGDRVFHLLLLGNVACNPDQTDDVTPVVPQRDLGAQIPFDGARRIPRFDFLKIDDRLAPKDPRVNL